MHDGHTVGQRGGAAIPRLGRLCRVQETSVYSYQSGSGGPAVVILPGAGLVGLDFLTIHDRVAETTGSLLYDRAGTGWSERVELPRSPDAVVDELTELLNVLGPTGPVVLVGHSLGASTPAGSPSATPTGWPGSCCSTRATKTS